MTIFLGNEADNQRVELDPTTLLRHVVCLGASGSGKTVACKVLCEEFLLRQVPVIAIDPQGDIASMLLPGTPEELASKGLDPTMATKFHEEVEVVVWTPASRAGIPISLDPLKLDHLPGRKEEQVRLLSALASNFTALLGYSLDSNDSQFICAYLDLVLQYIVDHNIEVEDLAGFAALLDDLPEALAERTQRVIPAKKREEVGRKIEVLSIGAKRLLFQMGVPLDIRILLGEEELPDAPTRLSVIYLNTLHSQEEKEFFVSQLAQALYDWMLNNPSSTPQAAFYMDEIAPYMPPVRKPACKDGLKLLFKQARKYGISCLIASQNPGDIDYTALSQFSTWMLGRLMVRQDIQKVEKLLRSISPSEVDRIIEALPGLDPGQFLLISPDNFDRVVTLQLRWLFTRHATLDEDQLEERLSDELREKFNILRPQVLRPQPSPVEPEPQKEDLDPYGDDDEEEDPYGEDLDEDEEETAPPPIKRKGKHHTHREQLYTFFQEHPGAYTIKELNHQVNLSVGLLRRVIKEFQEEKEMNSAKVGRSHYYWLASHKFDPGIGLRRPILAGKPRAKLEKARKLASNQRQGVFLGLYKTETLSGPESKNLLLWQVVFVPERPAGFIQSLWNSSADKEIALYFHARTGDLLLLEQNRLHFLPTEGKSSERIEGLVPDKLEDLLHFAEFTPKTPAELKLNRNTIKALKSPSGIEASCLKLFDGEVKHTQLVSVPYWAFELRNTANKRRPFLVDQLTGHPFELPLR